MRVCAPTIMCIVLSFAPSAFSQSASQPTAEELAQKTALLKAQQAYYDQLLATAKSQQAATDAGIATATASLTLSTALQQAQMTSDLAMSSALKNSGLSAATGKEGNITLSSADKTLLALQRGSLVGIDKLANHICSELNDRQLTKLYIAPQNYETLVEKSVPDVIQLAYLNSAATAGLAEYKAAQMEFAATAVAGAMVGAQYLAGGVQALSKLFRSDYSVALTTSSRPNLLEQRVAAQCGRDVITYNVEGRLRLNAAEILDSWIPNMAHFSQVNDSWNESVTASVTNLTQKRAAIVADGKLSPEQKSVELKLIDQTLQGFSSKQAALARYKGVAAAIKAFLAGLGPQSAIYDSLVWGQDYLTDGLPTTVDRVNLKDKSRLVIVLTAQDAAVTKSAAFSGSTIKGVSTLEAYYSVIGTKGELLLSGVWSDTDQTPPMKFSNPALMTYEKTLPAKPAHNEK